jgi:hypothetical protein
MRLCLASVAGQRQLDEKLSLARLLVFAVRERRTLAPDLSGLGHKLNQALKCLTVAHLLRSVPIMMLKVF